MKSTEETTKKNSTMPENRIDKMLNALLLLAVCAILLVGVVLGITAYRNDRKMDLSLPYSMGKYLEEDSPVFPDVGTADPFAKDLCVSPDRVSLGEIQFADSEKAGLFALNSKETRYAQGIYDRVYPASITKIMTAMLALEYGNPDQAVTMTAEDLALEEGSQMSGLKAGDTVTMDQLFHTLIIYSANDAAMAIARTVDGSVEQFVNRMNERAASLGMTGTHFVNPHGLHNEEHYTTAYDVYLMLQEAIQYQKFRETMSMASYTLNVTHEDQSVSPIYLSSTDKYLTGEASVPPDITVLGGKTGTTSQAGACLAIAAQNAYGEPYISVILNAKTKAVLYEDMNTLLNQMNAS